MTLHNPLLELHSAHMERLPEWPFWDHKGTMEFRAYQIECADKGKANSAYHGPRWRKYMDDSSAAFAARNDATRNYAWAVPDERAFEIIANIGKPVVEVGAGGGYWAWCAKQLGLEWLPFDSNPYPLFNGYVKRAWAPVAKKPAQIASRYPDHTLVLIWPVYDGPQAFDAITSYDGDHVVYVGESDGGCTGDDRFFEELERSGRWRLTDSYLIPQWSGIRDWLFVYRRHR